MYHILRLSPVGLTLCLQRWRWILEIKLFSAKYLERFQPKHPVLYLSYEEFHPGREKGHVKFCKQSNRAIRISSTRA